MNGGHTGQESCGTSQRPSVDQFYAIGIKRNYSENVHQRSNIVIISRGYSGNDVYNLYIEFLTFYLKKKALMIDII